MRSTVIGAVVSAGLVLAVWGAAPDRNPAFADRANSVLSQEGGLITLTAPAGDNRQMLTVIDPAKRVMSVYHVSLTTGQIELKSVRNINYDLEIMEFNGVSPLPRDIRTMLEQQ